MVVLMDPNDDGKDVLRLRRSREKKYAFDRAYATSAGQDEVYEGSCQFLLPGVIDGFNATVFAYGPTGSGKTFTMVGDDKAPGVMVQAISDLFTLVGKETDPDVKHLISVSYVEIYNENIRDLLVADQKQPFLDLREDGQGNSVVCNVHRATPTSTKEMMKLLKDGNKRRTTEGTMANRASSRSHAVLEVTVERWSTIPETGSAKVVVSQPRSTGRLFMIDLAGSERAQATGNSGQRMLEGQHINRSLLALGNCINALGDTSQTASYVNYRDSKLTRILKDSLGGNCRTVMIACASPASNHFEETYNTMNYANRAKNIKTVATKNVKVVEAHVTQYVEMIAGLRDQVTLLKRQLSSDALNRSDGLRPPLPPVGSSATTSPAKEVLDWLDTAYKHEHAARKQLAKVSADAAAAAAAHGASPAIDRKQQQLVELVRERTETVARLMVDAADQLQSPNDRRMLELMARNSELETRTLNGVQQASEDGGHAAELALRDRIIEAQRVLLKQQKQKLGRKAPAQSPELGKMYKDLETLRSTEAKGSVALLPPPRLVLPGLSSNTSDTVDLLGMRKRPTVGEAAVGTGGVGGEQVAPAAPPPPPPSSESAVYPNGGTNQVQVLGMRNAAGGNHGGVGGGGGRDRAAAQSSASPPSSASSLAKPLPPPPYPTTPNDQGGDGENEGGIGLDPAPRMFPRSRTASADNEDVPTHAASDSDFESMSDFEVGSSDEDEDVNGASGAPQAWKDGSVDELNSTYTKANPMPNGGASSPTTSPSSSTPLRGGSPNGLAPLGSPTLTPSPTLKTTSPTRSPFAPALPTGRARPSPTGYKSPYKIPKSKSPKQPPVGLAPVKLRGRVQTSPTKANAGVSAGAGAGAGVSPRRAATIVSPVKVKRVTKGRAPSMAGGTGLFDPSFNLEGSPYGTSYKQARGLRFV
jgi:kinesin family protein 18/19